MIAIGNGDRELLPSMHSTSRRFCLDMCILHNGTLSTPWPKFFDRSILTHQNQNLKLPQLLILKHIEEAIDDAMMVVAWTFLETLTCVQTSLFNCQHPQSLWRWSSDVINLVKDIMQFPDQNMFLVKSSDQVDDTFGQQFWSKSILNLSSNFITYKKTWK